MGLIERLGNRLVNRKIVLGGALLATAITSGVARLASSDSSTDPNPPKAKWRHCLVVGKNEQTGSIKTSCFDQNSSAVDVATVINNAVRTAAAENVANIRNEFPKGMPYNITASPSIKRETRKGRAVAFLAGIEETVVVSEIARAIDDKRRAVMEAGVPCDIQSSLDRDGGLPPLPEGGLVKVSVTCR